jgi:hypothetical protein
MSKQDNDFSRRRMLGMTVGSVLRRRVVARIAAVLMGASLVFSGSASAHNISLDKAWEIARNYARSVRSESGGKYTHYFTDCYSLFQGHNHFVRCSIDYDNEKTKNSKTGSRACRESIDIYLRPHNQGETFDYYMRHRDEACGSRRLRGIKARY